jgi:hypothetical protein
MVQQGPQLGELAQAMVQHCSSISSQATMLHATHTRMHISGASPPTWEAYVQPGSRAPAPAQASGWGCASCA